MQSQVTRNELSVRLLACAHSQPISATNYWYSDYAQLLSCAKLLAEILQHDRPLKSEDAEVSQSRHFIRRAIEILYYLGGSQGNECTDEELLDIATNYVRMFEVDNEEYLKHIHVEYICNESSWVESYMEQSTFTEYCLPEDHFDESF